LGVPVALIEGRTTNIKVTTADDFLLAEALAHR
jgi:2-C-methyl-D-erythritol 4-phosphate cytidylyltransferase